ncbi:MAG TPA: hypothetical protein VGO49_04120 [Bradyrhizobium sp.]|jgi:hypothetical protein|nr:hypothetical protein [Bradyrhizobium sp.]
MPETGILIIFPATPDLKAIANMNGQLLLFPRLQGSDNRIANETAQDWLPARRRALRGRAGTREAILSFAVACLVCTVCLLCSVPVCFGQSAPAPLARSAPPDDVLDKYRSSPDTSAERMKGFDETIAKAKQAFDIAIGIVTEWRSIAADFDAYKVATENSAARCRGLSDDLEKLRPITFNRATVQELEELLAACRANVRRRILKVANFEEILRRADLEIITAVAERQAMEERRIKGATEDKAIEQLEKKVADRIKKTVTDGRNFLPDNRGN